MIARLSSRALPFGAQVVVEGEVERDRVAAVLGERELFVLLGADLDVVGLEPHGLAVDVELEVALLVERAARRRRRRSASKRLHRG